MTRLTFPGGRAVPRWAFGTMQWGGAADADAAAAMFAACRAAGIAHFDTAVGYADGASERITGNLVRPVREDIFLATKIGYSGDGDPRALEAQFERSRQQLGLDTIDLLYLHRFQHATPLEAQFELLAKWQDDGLIRHIGVSNFAAWQVMKAQHVCAQLGTRIDTVQPMYNLVKRQAEVELMPMAADQGIAVFPYSPLGGGLLTGKYASGSTQGRIAADATYAKRYAPGWMHDAASGLAALAYDLGVHPATLAVAWVAAHPNGPQPIVSGRSAAQLVPSLNALTFDMTPDLYARISALSPRPPPATDRLEEQ